jgi:hypothetical protein
VSSLYFKKNLHKQLSEKLLQKLVEISFLFFAL